MPQKVQKNRLFTIIFVDQKIKTEQKMPKNRQKMYFFSGKMYFF